jgi:hypothetical protein
VCVSNACRLFRGLTSLCECVTPCVCEIVNRWGLVGLLTNEQLETLIALFSSRHTTCDVSGGKETTDLDLVVDSKG